MLVRRSLEPAQTINWIDGSSNYNTKLILADNTTPYAASLSFNLFTNATILRANSCPVSPSLLRPRPVPLGFPSAFLPHALSFALARFSTCAIFRDAVRATDTTSTEGHTRALHRCLHNPTKSSGPRFASLHLKHHRSALV